MLTKLAPALRRSLLMTRPQSAVRCMSGAVPAHWKTNKEVDMETKAHMNCQPVPEGSWEEANKARVAGGNTVLAIGGVVFAVTVAVLYQQGVFYLHSAPKYNKNWVPE